MVRNGRRFISVIHFVKGGSVSHTKATAWSTVDRQAEQLLNFSNELQRCSKVRQNVRTVKAQMKQIITITS